jgi:hypothetical protein
VCVWGGIGDLPHQHRQEAGVRLQAELLLADRGAVRLAGRGFRLLRARSVQEAPTATRRLSPACCLLFGGRARGPSGAGVAARELLAREGTQCGGGLPAASCQQGNWQLGELGAWAGVLPPAHFDGARGTGCRCRCGGALFLHLNFLTY